MYEIVLNVPVHLEIYISLSSFRATDVIPINVICKVVKFLYTLWFYSDILARYKHCLIVQFIVENPIKNYYKKQAHNTLMLFTGNYYLLRQLSYIVIETLASLWNATICLLTVIEHARACVCSCAAQAHVPLRFWIMKC